VNNWKIIFRKSMNKYIWSLLILLLLVAGCQRGVVETETKVPTDQPSPTLSDVSVLTTSAPDPTTTALDYLQAWKNEDYSRMYDMLTSVSQDAINQEEFTKKYSRVAAEAALDKPGIDYEILSALVNPYNAQVSYRVSLHSVLLGDINPRETVMNLSLEKGRWRVQWDDGLILPDLSGGNYLLMEYRIPSRANIYDQEGRALVAQSDAVALGVDAGNLPVESDGALLSLLNRMTEGQIRPEALQPRLDNYRQNGWYLPIADFSTDVISRFESALAAFTQVVMQSFRSRYYFDGGLTSVAPHVTGYMSLIQVDEVEYFQRLGYRQDERVGRSGLENWGEPYLAGKRGGALYVVSPEGKTITKLAETNPQPSQAIYTTLDKELQIKVQEALGDFNGAIVVLERDTGRVLAMASSPSFNPNLFEATNYNRQFLIDQVFDPVTTPTLNRATQGLYPLGSVFKIITIAAALESGLYTPETVYNCGYFFTELQGLQLQDWTYERFLQDGKTPPSGLLTLPEGLMRSCNPFFYHIGLDLFNQGLQTAVSDMAQGFGLASLTGIELPDEKTGAIPVPNSQIDATNGAIGQGDTLVTPIQVARFVAALGNGGTLYRPSVIERITPPDGEPSYVFRPEAQGTLPISEDTLQVIQDAMVRVVEDPRGTARHRFANVGVKIAGKTGTAQTVGKPHSWFAGYTFSERENQPDIAVAVLVENQGEGSDYAAPIFRRVIEIYFSGQPLTQYWWESQIGVVRTPTPDVTATPEPTATETPEAEAVEEEQPAAEP
jgi:cell division protein FtsI/penicillin-binding protein 2